MGVDLRLLPVDGDCGQTGFSHTLLDVDRDYDLQEAICAMGPFSLKTFALSAFCSRVPDGSMEGECCYGPVREDCYAEQLQYLESPALIRAFKSCKRLSAKNKAVLAWLEAYTTERPCKVALYWH